MRGVNLSDQFRFNLLFCAFKEVEMSCQDGCELDTTALLSFTPTQKLAPNDLTS